MKSIKNSFLIILLMLLPAIAMAQDSPVQRWVRSFEGKSGITTVSISSAMFKLLSKVSSNDPEYKDIVRFASKLQEFKIVVVDDEDQKAKIVGRNEFSKLVSGAPLNSYDELMSINESGNHIVFRVLEKNDRILELVMTITGADQVIMYIKGDFKLNELTEISDAVNITGMNKIKKLKK